MAYVPDVKMFFVILQVRMPVAGASQETRVGSMKRLCFFLFFWYSYCVFVYILLGYKPRRAAMASATNDKRRPLNSVWRCLAMVIARAMAIHCKTAELPSNVLNNSLSYWLVVRITLLWLRF